MMLGDHLHMALTSIRASRLRSFLTLLGVIIGVASVITSVGLAEGVKKQINQETNKFGNDVLTVRPGKILNKNQQGSIVGINIVGQTSTTASLTEKDFVSLNDISHVDSAIPLSITTGLPTYQKTSFNDAVTIGTTPEFPQILSQDIEFGRFFDNQETDKNVAVIGQGVAEKLFQETVPLSKSFEFRGKEFVVYGVFEKFKNPSISQGIDFNNAIFIPYNSAKNVSGGEAQLYEILVKMSDQKQAEKVEAGITKKLKENHGGQEDFTILRSDDTEAIASSIIDLITILVTGIAGISMFVGGIGIMNVMLVAVTERTREIGLRKAVGATNRQILSQFMIESTVLSVWGAAIGVAFAGLLNILIRIFTNLQPVMSWQVIVFATAVSVLTGVLFGLAPAVKAARKDPIEALRAGLF